MKDGAIGIIRGCPFLEKLAQAPLFDFVFAYNLIYIMVTCTVGQIRVQGELADNL